MNTTLNNRLKSFAWRAGMMGIAAILAYASNNLGLLELNATVTTITGLVLGELSKYLNTQS